MNTFNLANEIKEVIQGTAETYGDGYLEAYIVHNDNVSLEVDEYGIGIVEGDLNDREVNEIKHLCEVFKKEFSA